MTCWTAKAVIANRCVTAELASDVSRRERRMLTREQVVSPCREPVPQVGDALWADAVLGERGVGDLAERPESVGEHVPVEAVVRCCCQFEQVLAGVPAAGEDRVDIEEVPRQGP